MKSFRSRIFYLLVITAAIAVILFQQRLHRITTGEELSIPGLELSPRDRILVLAPHPDDEVIGCAGVIQKAVQMNLPLRIAFLTYGDNYQWSFMVYRKHLVLNPEAMKKMGLIRHKEAVAAAGILGVSPGSLVFLGYPDYRTLNIWYSHWGDAGPARGMFTRVAEVPYENAMRPGTSYKGEEIVNDLKTILREFRPTKVFLSHPADHQPDHRALYLFARIALWDMEEEMDIQTYPYLVHFKRWPDPKGYRPEESLTPPGLLSGKISWSGYALTPGEIACKETALKAHTTQYKADSKYLVSFIRSSELFGDFPIVRLYSAASGKEFSLDDNFTGETPEELTEEERDSFVGLEEELVRFEEGNLIISVKLSRPLAGEVGTSIYIFGYRRDIPFEEMPKLHIMFGALRHRVYDQNKVLTDSSIKIVRHPKEINISIPLGVVNKPERILLSSQTYLGSVPLDWASWRILDLSRPKNDK